MKTRPARLKRPRASRNERRDRRPKAPVTDAFGTRIDPSIQENIRGRATRLKIPKRRVFVFPRLMPVMDGDRVVDAQLTSDEDLTEQQFRFSRWRFNTELNPE